MPGRGGAAMIHMRRFGHSFPFLCEPNVRSATLNNRDTFKFYFPTAIGYL